MTPTNSPPHQPTNHRQSQASAPSPSSSTRTRGGRGRGACSPTRYTGRHAEWMWMYCMLCVTYTCLHTHVHAAVTAAIVPDPPPMQTTKNEPTTASPSAPSSNPPPTPLPPGGMGPSLRPMLRRVRRQTTRWTMTTTPRARRVCFYYIHMYMYYFIFSVWYISIDSSNNPAPNCFQKMHSPTSTTHTFNNKKNTPHQAPPSPLRPARGRPRGRAT